MTGFDRRPGVLRGKAHLEPPLTPWPVGTPPEPGPAAMREGRTAPNHLWRDYAALPSRAPGLPVSYDKSTTSPLPL